MKRKKNELAQNFKIERSNELNTFNPKGLNLTEVRFLAIYQSKINARNPESRTVIFPLSEFCKIMEIENLNITHIKNVADNIICKPIHLPSDMAKNGLMVIPLFNECQLYQDDNSGEWLVKIECHQKALPYMFEMKKNYFTYELWNALKLKSVNQLRMYEILKQYEKIGERTIKLDDLKYMLGISPNKYAEYKIFSRDVLKVCQLALEQYTDIKFTFEPIKQGRKIHALKFTITKNKNFKDDLRLKEFINSEDLEDIKDVETVDKAVESLYYRCNEAYTIEQLKIMIDYIENSGVKINIGLDNYICSIYANIKYKGNKVNNLFKYTLGVIKKQLDEHIYAPPEQKEEKKDKKHKNKSVDDFKDLIHTTKRYMGEDESVKEEPPKKIEKPVMVQDVHEEEKPQELPVIEFKFAFDKDLTDYVSYDACQRLQALLERKYHKENTFWLFEDILTQEDIIKLVLEKHQVIVKPKQDEPKKKEDYDDFDEIINSGTMPF